MRLLKWGCDLSLRAGGCEGNVSVERGVGGKRDILVLFNLGVGLTEWCWRKLSPASLEAVHAGFQG